MVFQQVSGDFKIIVEAQEHSGNFRDIKVVRTEIKGVLCAVERSFRVFFSVFQVFSRRFTGS